MSSKQNEWKWGPKNFVYRWRLTVLGGQRAEVSAVTRLRMTSMVRRHMCTASTGILFGLRVFTSLRRWPKLGERVRAWPWESTHHSRHFSQSPLDSSSTPLHSDLACQKKSTGCSELQHTKWNIQNPALLSLQHRIMSIDSHRIYEAKSCLFTKQPLFKAFGRPWLSPSTHSLTIKQAAESLWSTHTHGSPSTTPTDGGSAGDSSGAKVPSCAGFGVTEPRQLIGWRRASLVGGRVKRRKGLLWSWKKKSIPSRRKKKGSDPKDGCEGAGEQTVKKEPTGSCHCEGDGARGEQRTEGLGAGFLKEGGGWLFFCSSFWASSALQQRLAQAEGKGYESCTPTF